MTTPAGKSLRGRRLITAAAVASVLLAACAGAPNGPSPPLARVVEVIDGDTIVVRSGSVEEPVRLIGIDTPEIAHHGQPGECGGAEAAARLAQLIPPGAVVSLRRDVEARDHFGRLLAYVAAGAEDLSVVLAAEGHAVALAIPPNLALSDVVATAVDQARRSGLGIWERCQLNG
ncbi:MAG: thermonuclease family protein [Acidimicrobiales bacterium]